MLAALRSSLPAASAARVHLLQADLRSFRLARRFPLIILPCNTLSTLPGATRPAFFQRVAVHLEPGGLFVASLPNPEVLAGLPLTGDPAVEETFPHPESGNPVQVSSAWERGRNHVKFFWIYDHLLPDGRVQRLRISARHELATPADYVVELQAGGLALTEMFGAFDQTPHTPESPFLILAARLI